MPEKKTKDQQDAQEQPAVQVTQDRSEGSASASSTPQLTRPQQEALRRKLKGKYH